MYRCARLGILEYDHEIVQFLKMIMFEQVEAETENSERLLTMKNTCQRYNLGMYQEPDQPAAFKHPPAPQYTVFYIARFVNEIHTCMISKELSLY